MVGLHDEGSGPPGSVKGGEFLAMLCDYWLLRNDCSVEFIGCNCIVIFHYR